MNGDIRTPLPAGERGQGSGFVIRGARVVVGDGTVLPRADVHVKDGNVSAVGAHTPVTSDTIIEAWGRVLMPGFVDAHTHALWAGSRLDEFEQMRRGASYLDILAAGGGILSTVRAVRDTSEARLADYLRRRLEIMLGDGTTTVEVKSGYGLTAEHELKMLRAIARAAQDSPVTVVPTALLGHALDPERPALVDEVIDETLPAVHAEFPGIAVDAFCETAAWTVDDCRRLFEKARSLGHPLRLHADQFNRLGGLDLALELGALSVDHLEASSPGDLVRLAESPTFGVMLPVAGFHTDGRYANARVFLDAGGKLVLATNCNPGSAPTSSIPFVVAVAVRNLGVTASEAIQAVTSRPAEMLGFRDRGRIAVGCRADLVLLRHADERMLGYEIGGNPVDLVVCNGVVSPGLKAGLGQEKRP